MTRQFGITFDYLCPFARNANEHVIAALRAGADLDVRWMPFSLAQGHVEDGEVAIWDRQEPSKESGILALQAGLAVRDLDRERFLDAHEELFAARHDRGEDLKDPDVVAKALGAAGVDPDTVFGSIDAGRALSTLREEHQAAADLEIWGVPTFVTDQRAVFVRLLDRPNGDARTSIDRIEQVVDLVADPLELHEFKQVDLPM